MASAMSDLTRAGDELHDFLGSLSDLPDGEMVVNPPGLMGCYTAKELREGLRMHALCVHSTGMGLASTYGKHSRAFDIWMDRIMAGNALAPQVDPLKLKAYMKRIRGLFNRPAPTPEPAPRELAAVGGDPWRSE